MSTAGRTRAGRLTASRRREEQVTALELFFDLVFVLAHVAFTLRHAGALKRERLATAMLLLALFPLAAAVPALAALAVLAAVLVLLVSYESIHYARARTLVRDAGME